MNFDPSRASFQARVYLVDGEVYDLEVWCHELDPMDPMRRPAAEWVKEFLECWDGPTLAGKLGLPDGNFQVLFDGEIRGWYDYWSEYDEEVAIRHAAWAPVPEEWWQNRMDLFPSLPGSHDD
jgi:hypothetical protein